MNIITFLGIEHLSHMEHIEHLSHMEHTEHLSHMEHIEHLSQMEHIEHLSYMEHTEHLSHMEHIEHLSYMEHTEHLSCMEHKEHLSRSILWLYSNMLCVLVAHFNVFAEEEGLRRVPSNFLFPNPHFSANWASAASRNHTLVSLADASIHKQSLSSVLDLAANW